MACTWHMYVQMYVHENINHTYISQLEGIYLRKLEQLKLFCVLEGRGG